ncbi:hypothetical protein [Plantibacter sp. RU18]|uniref:hypothetical protein n=1 Tax=Plantibacter sp. RU18 TaxID=3158143 RepID=UPI003D362FAB
MSKHPFFPSSWAGLLLGCTGIGVVSVIASIQQVTQWWSGSVLFLLIVATLATFPRVIMPSGTGLRSVVTQRTSGVFYGVALVGGVAAMTATALTGQPIWGYLGGSLILLAALLAAILVKARSLRSER